ncbi:MAG TPA: hypothetical protein VFO45_10165 [Sphingomicrobium sp.]|nr:hypothetical protein [Sphingomicrobium sp.]
MTSITIEWRDAGDRSVSYWVNGRQVGRDCEGFDAVLALVREHPDAQVVLKGGGASLGGESLEDSTPFANRFHELVEALGNRSLNWDLL